MINAEFKLQVKGGHTDLTPEKRRRQGDNPIVKYGT